MFALCSRLLVDFVFQTFMFLCARWLCRICFRDCSDELRDTALAQDRNQDAKPPSTSFRANVRCLRVMPLYEDVFAEPEYRPYIGLTVSQKRTLEEGGTIFGSYQGRFGLRRKPAEVPCTF